jgi:hypothetical protein
LEKGEAIVPSTSLAAYFTVQLCGGGQAMAEEPLPGAAEAGDGKRPPPPGWPETSSPFLGLPGWASGRCPVGFFA